MVVKKRRGAYHHPDLRKALIDAAVAVIGRHGAQALTLREVARRAGVTHAAPYRHFADRETLIAAVAEEGFRGLSAMMRAHMEPVSGDWVDALTECGVAYVVFATQHPAQFQVMFTSELRGHHPSLERASQESFAMLQFTIASGQAAGVFRGDDAGPAALAAWSVVHGLASLLVARRVEASQRRAAELARQAVALCIEGLIS